MMDASTASLYQPIHFFTYLPPFTREEMSPRLWSASFPQRAKCTLFDIKAWQITGFFCGSCGPTRYNQRACCPAYSPPSSGEAKLAHRTTTSTKAPKGRGLISIKTACWASKNALQQLAAGYYCHTVYRCSRLLGAGPWPARTIGGQWNSPPASPRRQRLVASSEEGKMIKINDSIPRPAAGLVESRPVPVPAMRFLFILFRGPKNPCRCCVLY